MLDGYIRQVGMKFKTATNNEPRPFSWCHEQEMRAKIKVTETCVKNGCDKNYP